MLELLAALALCLPAIGFLFGSCSRCCCAILFTDTFTRANSTSLGSDWDEVAGDWSISSNTLTIGDVDAVVLHTTTYDETVTGFHFYCSDMGLPNPVFEPSFTTTPRVIFGYTDSDNYYFVEIEYSVPSGTPGAASLYSRVAGVETLLAKLGFAGSVPGGVETLPTSFHLCLYGGIIAFGLDGEYMIADYSPGSVASKFGFGTGATVRSAGAWSPTDARIRTAIENTTTTASESTCLCTKQCAFGCADGAPYRETYTVDIDSFTCGDFSVVIGGTYTLQPKSVYQIIGFGYYQRWDSCEWSYLSSVPLWYLTLTFASGVWTFTISMPTICSGGAQGNIYTYESDVQSNCKFTGDITLTLVSETSPCSCSVEPPVTIALTRS